MENYGGWPQLPSFENHGFIFWKRRTMETMTMTREATPAERFSVWTDHHLTSREKV